jgi:glycosyltransferase involved in cell wall biosynthesis
MESLYDHALAIVFPSVYEGFGLPVAAGLLRGRPVLGIDNAMNRELKAAFDEGSLLTLLPSHAAMAAALHSLDRLESRTPPRHVRTWAQVAAETDEILRQAQDRPIDWARVFGRTREIHRILDVTRAVAPARDDLSFRQLSSLFLKKTARAIRRRIPASAAKKEGT